MLNLGGGQNVVVFTQNSNEPYKKGGLFRIVCADDGLVSQQGIALFDCTLNLTLNFQILAVYGKGKRAFKFSGLKLCG